MSPLWPPSPRFPALALELVRSKLPAPTLGIVRLVNRTARDEFVDGRATRVRRQWDDAPLSALASAAPRLRSVASICTCSRSSHTTMPPADCAALAEALERLPNGASSLRELRVGKIDFFVPPGKKRNGQRDSQCLVRLAAAVGRLPALELLEVGIDGNWNSGMTALVDALSRLGALSRLSIHAASWARPSTPPPKALLPLPSLRRLEALKLSGDAVVLWLPALLETTAAAAALPRLRDLGIDCAGQGGRPWLKHLPAVPWRAPWLSQLTRLTLWADEPGLACVARALSPGALPAVRSLKVFGRGNHLRRAELTTLLAACDAAALEALALSGASLPVARDAAAALPALRCFEVDRLDFDAIDEIASDDSDYDDDAYDRGAEWRAFCAAPLAPLTRLLVDVADHTDATTGAGARAARLLKPLLAACWARSSLRELSLRGLHEGPAGGDALRALRGLSQLTALTKLSLELRLREAPAFEEARSKGWAKGWAPRLVEFEVALHDWGHAAAVDELGAALFSLPFSRQLKRFSVVVDCGAVTQKQLAALSAAAAKAAPQLCVLEFSAARTVRKKW